MNTIKMAMEKYVDALHPIADPFGIGMSVHLAIFVINWLVLYLLTWGLTRKSNANFWKAIHEFSGIISFVLGYLLTVAFIWIKNN